MELYRRPPRPQSCCKPSDVFGRLRPPVWRYLARAARASSRRRASIHAGTWTTSIWSGRSRPSSSSELRTTVRPGLIVPTGLTSLARSV